MKRRGDREWGPPVEILLATFNSEAFLAEQLDSYLSQEHRNWRLTVSDGGSTDATMRVLQEFQAAHPDRVALLPPAGRLSCGENFYRLIRASSADYVMLSDHDDIWLPDKISASLAAVRQAEKTVGIGRPVLGYGDFSLVDRKGTMIADSFAENRHLEMKRSSLAAILFYPTTVGATFLMNRALCQIIGESVGRSPLYDLCIRLHAYWAQGEIVCIPGHHLLHRVHSGSLSILSRGDRPPLLRKLGTLFDLKEERAKFTAALRMCEEVLPVLERFGSE